MGLEQIILVVHLLVALVIIGLILLQQGKGADMGASFGAGASQTLFGSDGSGNALTKATTWMAVLFFATSFGLAMLAHQKVDAVDELDLMIPSAAEQSAPALEDLPVVEEESPQAMGTGQDELPELN